MKTCVGIMTGSKPDNELSDMETVGLIDAEPFPSVLLVMGKIIN